MPQRPPSPQVEPLPSRRRRQPIAQLLHTATVCTVPGTRWLRHVAQAGCTLLQLALSCCRPRAGWPLCASLLSTRAAAVKAASVARRSTIRVNAVHVAGMRAARSNFRAAQVRRRLCCG